MGRFVEVAALGLLFCLWTNMGAAAEISEKEITKEQIRIFDDQVQDIKKDVLDISGKMIQLEEKLINPPSTQVAIYLSVAQGDKSRLDAVKIKIDGAGVAQYIYSAKELEALQRGGVQRVYTGNLRAGEHVLDVEVIGKSASNSDYQGHAEHKFTKDVGTKRIEISLAGSGAGNQGISFRD